MSQVVRKLLFFQFILISITASAKTYYVAPTGGSDSNAGTNINAPWATWQKAFETAQAGDTVYFRGGVWYPTDFADGNSVTIIATRQVPDVYTGNIYGHNGTAENPICFFNYPGEKPILDCSLINLAGHNFNTGIGITFAEYLHFKGLTVRNVLQPTNGNIACGIGADFCSNMIFENMTVNNIGGRGYTYWGVNGYYGVTSDTVRYINCDAYSCFDALSEDPGNGADGWKCNNEPGGYMYFEGCRAWKCADDGFDPSGSGTVVFKGCWSFANGFPGVLDGNGFKSGGVLDSLPYPTRIYINNLSAFNYRDGFYDLEFADLYRNNSRFYNNTSYKNGIGIAISDNALRPNSLSIFRNNIIYNTIDKDAAGRPYNLDAFCYYTESHNTWDYAVVGSIPRWVPTDTVTVTDADFVSLDSTGLSGARQADGSLPILNFLKLAEGSDLIDAGTQIPKSDGVDFLLEYYGSAPDLGYSEYIQGTQVIPNPTYVSSVIENATPARLEITYNQTLANIVPAASAFAVKVNSVARTVSSVAISGTKVLLTLSNPVVYGDVVTVAYTKPASNPLQTPAGGQAASMAAQSVKNNVAAPNPVYVSSVIENATPARLEMTYNQTLVNIVPSASAFAVKVNSVARTVSSVAISGTKVLLTLSSPVVYGDVVTVAYTKPPSNPLQTPAGGQAASLAAQNTINNCSLIANQPPQVTLTSPTKSLTVMEPATITVEATATDADGFITRVEFYSGNTKLGEATSLPYSYAWKNVMAGTYSVHAVATDNSGSKTASEAVTVIVEKSTQTVNQLPVISVQYTTRGKSGKPKKNDSVVLTASAYDPDGTILNVEFKSGDATLAVVNTPPYNYTIQDIDTGTYIITAIATDNRFASTVSSPLVIDVTATDESPANIILSPNPNNGQFSVDVQSDLPEGDKRIKVIDLAGNIVYEDAFPDDDYYREFDLSATVSGTYILVISGEKRIIGTKKFIKR